MGFDTIEINLVEHNIGPNIEPKIEPNIETNIETHIEPNIEPNIEPSLTTLSTNSLKRRSEFVAVADAVEGMAIPGGDRQPSRAPTALKGMDLPAPWDPLRCTSSKRQIVEVIEGDQLGGTKRRDSPYI